MTLYVPASTVSSNSFLLTLLEFESFENNETVDFLDYPILDGEFEKCSQVLKVFIAKTNSFFGKLFTAQKFRQLAIFFLIIAIYLRDLCMKFIEFKYLP